MKKFIFSILFLFLSIFCFSQGFVVNKFTADITVDRDGWFDVIEKYDVNFTQYKHGLLRNIITKYKLDDGDRKIYISDIKVPNYKFSVTPNFIEKLDGKLEIKIGDKNKTVYGSQHYEISYRVKNAILFDKDYAMLYWNLKPDGWQADFEQIEFNIYVPDGSDLSTGNCFTYSGFYGNSTPAYNDFDYKYTDNSYSAKSKEGIGFSGYQNLTVLVKMPKELIVEKDYSPSAFMKYGWLGILALIGFYFWLIWKKYGEDDKVIAITSYYPPKGIDPAMAGYLINDKEDASDLIALIPKWGYEGLIKVHEIPKKGIFSSSDTKIIKLKEIADDCPDYEKTMFNGLFSTHNPSSSNLFNILDSIGESISDKKGSYQSESTETELDSVLISSLKESFYTTMNYAKGELKDQAQIYYEAKSNSIMNKSYLFTILGLFVVSGLFLFVFGFTAALVSVLFFVFLIIMSGYMKKKNKTGNTALSELKGFKQFVKLAETNRIKTLIQTDPDYFEKTMSYALAFGLLNEWAGKFASLSISPPQWYSSPNMVGIMSMNNFVHSFSNSIASTQSAMISTPSSKGLSGGGGFSGGGFGGGGGGSW